MCQDTDISEDHVASILGVKYNTLPFYLNYVSKQKFFLIVYVLKVYDAPPPF